MHAHTHTQSGLAAPSFKICHQANILTWVTDWNAGNTQLR